MDTDIARGGHAFHTPQAEYFDYENIGWYRDFLLTIRYNINLSAYDNFAGLIAGFINEKTRFADIQVDDESSQAIAADIAALKQDGFVRLPGFLSAAQVADIRRYFDQQPLGDRWAGHNGVFALDNAPKDINTLNYTPAQVAEAPHLLVALNHPRVQKRVQGYLGVPPTINHFGSWWSLIGREAPLHDQLFHIDRSCYRFLQLFIYMTDVADDGGPHVFVKGSHRYADAIGKINALRGRDPAAFERFGKLYGAQRKSDADVAAFFGAENIVELTGKAGDAFLVCTGGMHKGKMPVRAPRLIFASTMQMLPRIKGDFPRQTLPGFIGRLRAEYGDAVSAEQMAYTNRLVIKAP